jgi:hypothetical protein
LLDARLGISQGVGNGLCGVMSWANAVDALSDGALSQSETRLEDFLEFVGHGLAERFGSDPDPELRLTYANAYTGLDFPHVVAAGDFADAFARRKLGFGLERHIPWVETPPASFEMFWTTLREAIAGPSSVAIIGLEAYAHIICVTELFDDTADKGSSIMLCRDSYDLTSIRRRDMGLAPARRPMNVAPLETIIIRWRPK